MVAVDIKGIHIVRSKLADGTVKQYCYPRRGAKPAMKTLPGDPGFVAELSKRRRELEGIDTSTSVTNSIGWLVRKFRSSSEYGALKPDTLKDYDVYLTEVDKKFGTMSMRAAEAKGARAVFRKWRDGYSQAPVAANRRMAVLRRLFNYALDQEWMDRNPVAKLKAMPERARADIIWDEDQIEAFLDECPDHIRRPFIFSLWTGQRQRDVLQLDWKQVGETHILIQSTSKTGSRIRLRISPAVAEVLEEAGRKPSGPVFRNLRGRAWTPSGFQSSLQKHMEHCGLSGEVRWNDLRGTAVTRAYRGGAKIHQIAEMTGHTEESAEKVIRTHYLAGDDVVMAMERYAEE